MPRKHENAVCERSLTENYLCGLSSQLVKARTRTVATCPMPGWGSAGAAPPERDRSQVTIPGRRNTPVRGMRRAGRAPPRCPAAPPASHRASSPGEPPTTHPLAGRGVVRDRTEHPHHLYIHSIQTGRGRPGQGQKIAESEIDISETIVDVCNYHYQLDVHSIPTSLWASQATGSDETAPERGGLGRGALFAS